MSAEGPSTTGAQPAEPVADHDNANGVESDHDPERRDNNNPDSPGSPPLPAPHTAVTPGPRAARLQELFATSLAHTLNKISWENLAACYPTIAAKSPDLLKGVRKTMVEKMESKCKVRHHGLL